MAEKLIKRETLKTALSEFKTKQDSVYQEKLDKKQDKLTLGDGLKFDDSGNLAVDSTTAVVDKASKDGEGNVITETYATKTELTTETTAREDADTALSERIDALGSALKYKGSVDTYDALPTDAEIGDTYNVKEAHEGVAAGTNWAWNGTEWDALAGVVDLSEYLKSADAANTYLTKTDASTTYATQEDFNTLKEEVDNLEFATDAEVIEDVDSLF